MPFNKRLVTKASRRIQESAGLPPDDEVALRSGAVEEARSKVAHSAARDHLEAELSSKAEGHGLHREHGAAIHQATHTVEKGGQTYHRHTAAFVTHNKHKPVVKVYSGLFHHDPTKGNGMGHPVPGSESHTFHPTVDAAMAHVKKVHTESVEAAAATDAVTEGYTATVLAKAGVLRAMAKHNKGHKAIQAAGDHAVHTGTWPSTMAKPAPGKWTADHFESGAKEHERLAKAHESAAPANQDGVDEVRLEVVAESAPAPSTANDAPVAAPAAVVESPPAAPEAPPEPGFLGRMLGALGGAPVAEATPEAPAVVADAPEPSFADRLLVAARLGEASAPVEEEVYGVILGNESAAFALVEKIELTEMGADDHVVHVNYKLHSNDQAKHTVHHLIHHAMKHGAHAHEADGYDGHVAFHFKKHEQAKHFMTTAKNAAHVHKVVHHEPAYEAVLMPVPTSAKTVRLVPVGGGVNTGGKTAATVHLTTDMGAAAVTLDQLLAIHGGKIGEGGGYEFPVETAQAFLNQYMVNGGLGYIDVPLSAGTKGRAGPNESIEESGEKMYSGHHLAVGMDGRNKAHKASVEAIAHKHGGTPVGGRAREGLHRYHFENLDHAKAAAHDVATHHAQHPSVSYAHVETRGGRPAAHQAADHTVHETHHFGSHYPARDPHAHTVSSFSHHAPGHMHGKINKPNESVDESAYHVLRAARDHAEAAHKTAADALKTHDKHRPAPGALLPDHVKASPEYKAHRAAVDAAHAHLQHINRQLVKHPEHRKG